MEESGLLDSPFVLLHFLSSHIIMTIAYFILVHRYPNQFKRLFKAIYDPNNVYVIHVDKRSDKTLHKELKTFLVDFSNVHILPRQNVVWGGYSMVDVELKGMKKLLSLDVKWDFFINLSGQDFPLQNQTTIKKFLQANKRKDFILFADQAVERPNTLNRINNYFVEIDDGFSGVPYERAFMPEVIPYIGGQWKMLSRKTCMFICKNSQVKKFKEYYRNTLIADEGFFQTVLMNTTPKKILENDDKRAIIWIPDIALNSKITAIDTQSLVDSGEIKLRPKTFTISDLGFLLESKALFARKFDETVDDEILNILESKLEGDQLPVPSVEKKIFPSNVAYTN